MAKRILITGGTGTVGLALAKRLLGDHGVEQVRLFSRDEYKQFELMQSLDASERVRYLIGDVRDHSRLLRAMEGVDTVFHVAAMKHVPSSEYNPFEAVKTNVVGTQNVIDCAIERNVEAVVYTSTDKAAGPTNVMGATKLLAERLISAAHRHKGPRKTRFLSVRFGNVLGSRGSVVPLFARQAQQGVPLTVTDPEMTRFFMSIGEAVRLILSSLQVGKGGESFVFKMPVVRLGDLARSVWNAVNSTEPYREEAQGLRPGEKMYEELLTEEEAARAVEMADMYAVLPYGSDPGAALEGFPNAKRCTVCRYASDDQACLSAAETDALVKQALAEIERNAIEPSKGAIL